MRSGRPPVWNPVSALEPRAWTEVVGLTSKNRLQFPVGVRARVPWLSDPIEGLLAVLEPSGSAEILPWQPHGETELQRIREALASADAAIRGELAIAAMDRYVKLTLDPDGRTVLPSNLAFHLDAVTFEAVRITAIDGRLWVWSEHKWQDRRSERVASLAQHLTARAHNLQ